MSTEKTQDLLPSTGDEVGIEVPPVATPVVVRDWWLAEGVQAPCICNIRASTREFMGAGVADYSPLEPGVWLIPANAFQCEPPTVEEGYAAIRSADGTEWLPVIDHRGKTIYSTATGEPTKCESLGELTADWTLTAPKTEFDEWDNGEWVPDQAALDGARLAQAAKKKSLLTQLSTTSITTLQYAADLDMATDEETATLKAWKVFQVYLSRVPADPTAAQWPVSPMGDATNAWLAAQGYVETVPAAG